MKEAEVIAETDNLRVRIMALAARELTDWHYHTQVTDVIFCLTGEILIRQRNPDVAIRLRPGERCQVKAGRVHQLENIVADEATYLLVQGIGKYDFNDVGE